jgi:hypothetical protein
LGGALFIEFDRIGVDRLEVALQESTGEPVSSAGIE